MTGDGRPDFGKAAVSTPQLQLNGEDITMIVGNVNNGVTRVPYAAARIQSYGWPAAT